MSQPNGATGSFLARHFWAVLVFCVVSNFGAAELCQWLSIGLGPVAGFWIPGGISLAIMVRYEPRRWPLLTLACGAGTFLFDLQQQKSLSVCLGFAAADCLEVLSGAWLIHYLIGPAFTLTRLSHLFALTCIVAAGSSIVGATIGAATTAAAFAAPFPAAWLTWWISEILGVLVTMPLVLATLPDPESGSSEPRRWMHWLEGIAMLLTIALVTQLIFGGDPASLPLPYLPIVLLMWPAIRFGWRGVAIAEFLLTILAVANTTFGKGPYAGFAKEERTILLQSLLSVSSVSFLALTAIINERQRFAEKLAVAREEWEQCFNAIPDCICILDAAGRILRCNRAMRQRFESAHSNLIGLQDAQVFCGTSAPERPMPWAPVLAGGTPIECQLTLPALPGYHHVAAYPLKHSFGMQWGCVVILRDITERKKLEEQLLQSQKMDAIGQLAGGVAHDFNNLLTVIAGYVENSLDADVHLDEAVRLNLTQIRNAADRAAGLTRQLLAFSRQSMVEPRILDLNAVIQDSQLMLRRIMGENIEFSVTLDPALTPIKADAGQVGQILLNLAVNARDSMPKGGKFILATRNVELDESYSKLQPDARAGAYAMLSVSDTGCGMKPEIKARAFEPFFTTKSPGTGTGLGLAVVHGIIRQNGGHIDLYSEPGIGSTFKLYFPVAAGIPDLSAKKDRGEAKRGNETILLVEDEEPVRKIAELTLSKHGYAVLSASRGNEALKLAEARQGQFALLLTDVVMPGMSGRELADSLRARDPNLKVLFMSGYTSDAAVQYGVLEGDAELLQKPFTPTALAIKVREVLDKPAAIPKVQPA